MERVFCDAFVENGGNGEDAALAAGYSPGSAKVSACRLLCRERVAARIKAQCEAFAHTQLPAAIRTLVEICGNGAILPKDRIKAANSLVELAGMTAPRGGVNVNVGVQVNGQQAQSIIASVHEARAKRLSDIPAAMPDTLESDLKTIEALTIEPPPATPGGDQLQGPGAGTCPIPPPSSTELAETDDLPGHGAERDEDAPSAAEHDPHAAFRKAFDAD